MRLIIFCIFIDCDYVSFFSNSAISKIMFFIYIVNYFY